MTTIYDIVTENGKLLGPSEEFNQEQFQAMMRGELVRYARQKLVNTFIYAPNVRIAYPTGVSIQKYFFFNNLFYYIQAAYGECTGAE